MAIPVFRLRSALGRGGARSLRDLIRARTQWKFNNSVEFMPSPCSVAEGGVSPQVSCWPPLRAAPGRPAPAAASSVGTGSERPVPEGAVTAGAGASLADVRPAPADAAPASTGSTRPVLNGAAAGGAERSGRAVSARAESTGTGSRGPVPADPASTGTASGRTGAAGGGIEPTGTGATGSSLIGSWGAGVGTTFSPRFLGLLREEASEAG